MKHEYLKRLDRAFTEAPPQLHDQIELAFVRGEQAMKKRHKLMVALSAAVACAVIFAALALAAGQLTRPRRDVVVTSQIENEASGEKLTTDKPTPTPMPEEDVVIAVPTPTPIPAQPTPSPMPYFDTSKEQPEAIAVYCSDADGYYHGAGACAGKYLDRLCTLQEATAEGKVRCSVCQPMQPDHYDLFLKAFGDGLGALYPGYRYAFMGRNASFYDSDTWYVTDGEAELPACTAISCLKQDGNRTTLKTRVGELEDVICFTLTRSEHCDLWAFLSGAPQPQREMIFSEVAEDAADRALREIGAEQHGDIRLLLNSVWVAVKPDGTIEAAEMDFISDDDAPRTVRLQWMRMEDGGYEQLLVEVNGEGQE